jgi:hypothetical protein
MKKLIQISLVVILVVIALQASIGGSIALSIQTSSHALTTISGTIQTASGGQVAVLVCPNGLRYCAVPQVGWNS